VRSFWRVHQDEVSAGCVDGVSRTLQYGLNYYAGHLVPECAVTDAALDHITTRHRQLTIEDSNVH
jgi:hypothetical protein